MKELLFVLFASVLAISQEQHQGPTIPEELARQRSPVNHLAFTPSGISPTVETLLAHTDLIVRAEVGDRRSYLSSDQREVYTDYQLIDPRILFSSGEVFKNASRVATSLVVTLFGGTIELNGLTYSSVHQALPELLKGEKYTLLWRQDDSHLFVAGRYFGVFRIVN